MTRTLIRLKTAELISYAESSADDHAALKACSEEINFRTRAIKAGKFHKLMPWIENRLKITERTAHTSEEESSFIYPDETIVDNSRATRFDLNKDELEAFMLLCACFVILDKTFSIEEEEFIERLLEAEQIQAYLFDTAMHHVSGENVKKIFEEQLLALRNLTRNQKQQILEILFELSLSDGTLHVEEKLFLEAINRYWGLHVVFGKGELDWTKEQLEIIEADEERRIVVNAMPGAGKTAVACAKISRMIDEGIPASQIWLMSFTRTAVQELRNRIASFAEEDEDVIGVKIATIDSRAWQLRFGMRDEQGKNLFQSYDLSISEALSLIKANPEDYEQAFGGISHVIIDEAQDITGVRLQLIEAIVEMLPPKCGVTIFGDEAQAIYGFTSDEQPEAAGQNFLKVLRECYSENFEFLELNSMHRTDNLALLKLVDELRLEIQVENPRDVIKQEDAAEKIRAASDNKETLFQADEYKGLDDTLVLFRRRSDVLQACNFANRSNVKYRIRMGGLSVICRPWIGQIFFGNTSKLISQTQFEEFWQLKSDVLLNCGDTAYSAFYRLKNIANDGGKISLRKLRNAMSRPVPPVELCLQDLGTEGPILGTIHASKGREAENVRLFLNPISSKKKNDEEKAEETRVLFVGASRAKSSLSVGKGYVAGGSRVNGRSYKKVKNQKNKAQVEVGKAGDFDIFSVVNKTNITENKAAELQQKLVRLLSTGPKDVLALQNPSKGFVYDLYVLPETENIWIGQFNQQLNSDLFTVKDQINPDAKKSITKRIQHLKFIGLNTAAMPDNQNEHPMSDSVVDMAKESGFWLVPIVMGYPTIGFW